MSGVCPLHQRAAEQTCKRCGVFMCDWCVKLAPDWGAGLCHDCVRHDAPKTRVVKMTLTTAFVVALLGLIGLFNLVALIQSVGDPDATVPGRIAQGIVAVIGLVGSIVIVMMNRR